jgi:hypothetical protein
MMAAIGNRTLAWALALAGCAGQADGPGTPEPALTEGPSPQAKAEKCLAETCPATAAAALRTVCLKEKCGLEPETVAVDLQQVKYDGNSLLVKARLAYSPVKGAETTLPRATPIYVGVTAISESGEELDLAVQTLFPDGLDEPVLMASEVGPGVKWLVVGAWNTKIEPCSVDRAGCRNYGFVLDGSLAVWPPGFYDGAGRQRVLAGNLEVARSGDAAKIDDRPHGHLLARCVGGRTRRG